MSTSPTFYLQGFDTPPYGIIDVLRQLSWPIGTSIHILDPLNDKTLSMETIAQDSSLQKFVIINTHEGASHHWFDRLIPDLQNQCKLPLDQIILRSSCLYNPDSPVEHIGSVVDYATDTVSEYPHITEISGRTIGHHYVCLNNQHRWQRLELIKLLIDRGLIDYGRVSYLNAPRSEIETQYHDRFPMVLDKKDVTWSQGHVIDLPALQGAAFNIITESSYEKRPGSDRFETHHLPGLTEKTFKTILLSQFPIFVAPANTVRCYRDLGFDAFDDIIDHSYDLELDPRKRLSMIADQIDLCVRYSLSDLQRLSDQNRDRFQKNLDRFRWFANNHQADLPKWQEWLDRWKDQKIFDHK